MLNRKDLLLSSVVAIALFSTSSAHARYENDVRLGTLLESAIPEFVYPDDYTGDTSEQPDLDEEIRLYFEEGYHPVVVLFYAMRNGMGANEAIDIAEDAGLVKEHINKARQSLEPVLPGSICGTSYFVKDPTAIPGTYSLSELKDELEHSQDNGSEGDHQEPVLEDLLEKYFDENDVISVNQDDPNLHQIHDVDWTDTTSLIPASGVPDNVEDFLESGIPAHMHASADELLALIEQSGDYWFFDDSPIPQGRIDSESLNVNAPILISLYSDEEQAIVAHGQIDRVNQAKLDGTRLPVKLFYSSANLRPLSQVSKKIGFPELANAYIRQGIKVAPAPSWEEGNYHTLATYQLLRDLFELPEKDDIPEERYERALSLMDNARPLQVAFVGGRIFLDDPDRTVAMGEDGGYDLLPIHASYVDLEPDEEDFSVCRNAFPFAGSGGLVGIGGPSASGVVVIPEPLEPPEPPEPPKDCMPKTKTIQIPRHTTTESPTRRITVIDTRTITIPCPKH